MKQVPLDKIKLILDEKVIQYNTSDFIAKDPISIPHRFSQKQDIEISAFFAAIFAWGNRTTIISKTSELLYLMDDAPYDFIRNHHTNDLKRFAGFAHRTFNSHDLYYFLHFLSCHFQQYESLEYAFLQTDSIRMKDRISAFHDYFFSMEHLQRTRKHISNPVTNSACKRINMFLRWMVRSDFHGVDFGLWSQIKASQLICPLDIHVCRVAYQLGLLPGIAANWKQAELLTNLLVQWDPDDPVKYDIALFSLGVEEKYR